MNQIFKSAVFVLPLLAVTALASGNKRARVYTANADTLMTNVSSKYTASPDGRGWFDFAEAISGRMQVKTNIRTPSGEIIEQSQDRTSKEIIESYRQYESKVQLKPNAHKADVIDAVVTTKTVSDDDSGQAQTQVDTVVTEYQVTSGSWNEYFNNGSRIELEQTVSSVLFDTPRQIEKAVSKAAKAKGATARLISWEQTAPSKIVVDGSGSLITSNAGALRFVIEMRIPENTGPEHQTRVRAETFNRVAN
jgi:hypothetical protein